MNRDEVLAQYPSAVASPRGPTASPVCTIQDIPFAANFVFHDGKLTSVELTSDNKSEFIARNSPNTFCELLMGKYGAPLKIEPTFHDGLWRTDRTVIKFRAPATPSPDVPAFSIYYWSLDSPQYRPL